jgi:hypothetical protein
MVLHDHDFAIRMETNTMVECRWLGTGGGIWKLRSQNLQLPCSIWMVYQGYKKTLIQMMSWQRKHFGTRYQCNRVLGIRRLRMVSPSMTYPTYPMMQGHTNLFKVHLLLRQRLPTTSSKKYYLDSSSLSQHKSRLLM